MIDKLIILCSRLNPNSKDLSEIKSLFDYLCEVAHAQARYLGLVKEGENAWEVEDWQVPKAK